MPVFTLTAEVTMPVHATLEHVWDYLDDPQALVRHVDRSRARPMC